MVKSIMSHKVEIRDNGINGKGIFAKEFIKKGEELTTDYAFIDNEDYKFECTCGSKNCRKIVTGYDWKIKELQDKYYNYFAQYLKEKIDEERRLEEKRNEK